MATRYPKSTVPDFPSTLYNQKVANPRTRSAAKEVWRLWSVGLYSAAEARQKLASL